MIAWSDDELAKIGEAEELKITSRRADGSLRRFVTIWCVRLGEDIYVRSAGGSGNPWFRRALASVEGRILAGGVERDVAFEEPGPDVAEDLHAAYHTKYDRYGPEIVGTVVSQEAARSTLRLVPR